MSHNHYPPDPIDKATYLERVSYAQDILWSTGIKATAPRVALIDEMNDTEGPLTVPQLQEMMPFFSTAGLYRTLKLFVDKGILREVHTGQSQLGYEYVYGRSHHHHLICTDCGVTEEVRQCIPEATEREALAKSVKFASITRHSLEFFGMCNTCRGKN